MDFAVPLFIEDSGHEPNMYHIIYYYIYYVGKIYKFYSYTCIGLNKFTIYSNSCRDVKKTIQIVRL